MTYLNDGAVYKGYRERMKDDAIAQLSDQVMALTARMQEFERRQS